MEERKGGGENQEETVEISRGGGREKGEGGENQREKEGWEFQPFSGRNW